MYPIGESLASDFVKIFDITIELAQIFDITIAVAPPLIFTHAARTENVHQKNSKKLDKLSQSVIFIIDNKMAGGQNDSRIIIQM